MQIFFLFLKILANEALFSTHLKERVSTNIRVLIISEALTVCETILNFALKKYYTEKRLHISAS